MKSILSSLIISSFILYSAVLAQETTKKEFLHHEINVGFSNLLGNDDPDLEYYYYPPILYSGNVIPDIAYYPYPIATRTIPQYGLGYKYRFGKNAARVAFSIGLNNEESDNPESNGIQNEITTEFFALSGRVGWERNLLEKDRLNFYGAIDVIVLIAENNTESKNTSADQISISSNDATYDAFGGSLALGIRYFLHDHLSFSVESRVEHTFYTREDKFRGQVIGITPSLNESGDKYTGNELSFQPLGFFSMNVHF